jgi:uncharacterized protein
MPISARVTSLHIYPVKSCRGIELPGAALGERGFDGDREWMIVDPRGRFITQRTHPQLARIETSFDGHELVLRHAGRASLVVPRNRPLASDARRQVSVWKDCVAAHSCGPEAAAWLSDCIGAPVELVQASAATQREPAEPWRNGIAAPVNFPDGFPLLVCSSGSLADLNSRMPEAVPMTRFRPNIVLDGPPPYAEDELPELHIGAVQLRLVKPCTRCTTTIVDQETGEPGSNPLPTLRAYRFDAELLGVTFGQNALIVAGIGQTVLRGAEAELR